MKILAVNKFYYMKGGSEAYYFSLNNLCIEKGYEIIPFSMKDEKNFKSKYEEYFINNISYANMNLKTKIMNSAKMIYSVEAYKKIKKIVKDTKPDLAHLHIFQHQLSPSIIQALRREGIPIVNTIHDLKIICPNYKMLNKNGICEECKEGKYYNCFINSCIKNSKLDSLVTMFEAYLHKYLKSYLYVNKYICPSEFYRKKLLEFGIPENKVVHIPNYIDIKQFKPCYEAQNYFIYAGRLSEEKGIKTLIKAMKYVKTSKLCILGAGPLESELRNEVKDFKLNNIEFLGFKTGKELENIIRNSKFIIIPSEWYENCPMSVIEAMAYGKPVIGSNLGGIPELIQNEITGFIFSAGNEEEMASKINYLLDNPTRCRSMGKEGRMAAQKLYNKDIHFQKLNDIYKSLLSNQ